MWRAGSSETECTGLVSRGPMRTRALSRARWNHIGTESLTLETRREFQRTDMRYCGWHRLDGVAGGVGRYSSRDDAQVHESAARKGAPRWSLFERYSQDTRGRFFLLLRELSSFLARVAELFSLSLSDERESSRTWGSRKSARSLSLRMSLSLSSYSLSLSLSQKSALSQAKSPLAQVADLYQATSQPRY